jgi:hypothetical protein
MPNEVPTRVAADAPAVRIVAHPPERGPRRPGPPLQAGACCCCCCCCCLHSIGGIIGAAVAPLMGGRTHPGPYLPPPHYRDDHEGLRPWSPPPREAVTAEEPLAPAPPRVPLGPAGGPPRVALPGSDPSAVSLFWWVLLALVLLGCLLGSFHGAPQGPLIAGVIILLVLPGLQLGAGVVTLLILAVSPRQDKAYQLWQLGKIFLGVIVGAGAGLLIMLGLFVLLAHSRM